MRFWDLYIIELGEREKVAYQNGVLLFIIYSKNVGVLGSNSAEDTREGTFQCCEQFFS